MGLVCVYSEIDPHKTILASNAKCSKAACNTSPPTLLFLADLSDITPLGVDKIDIPKPNNYCKTVRGRDPYDTSQLLTRTDKMPMSQNNKDRLKKYEGKPTIQEVLDKGILNLNDIKYDIKLGYITKTSKPKG